MKPYLVIVAALLSGCTDESSLMDEAYTEGYREGYMLCSDLSAKRAGIVLEVPPYSPPLRDEWYRGFAVGEIAGGCAQPPYPFTEFP